MKTIEKEVVRTFNNKTNANLILCQFPYARYDAFNDYHIVEVKYRHKWYDDMIIEFDKYSFNLLYAHLADKKFLYVVGYKNVLLSFNITDLTKNKYDFRWEWRQMPKTTEFDNSENVAKFVGYLNTDDCEFRFDTTDIVQTSSLNHS